MNYTHITTGNAFIFTYQEWQIKGTICIQVEYDRTSYIVFKNLWLVYNFLWSDGGNICVYTSIMCINILHNIKAVAPKL
jgi:hypothetical protein